MISEKLDVQEEILKSWEDKLNIKPQYDNEGNRIYTDYDVLFFKKVKYLVSEGVRFNIIKKVLKEEIEIYNCKVLKCKSVSENDNKPNKDLKSLDENTLQCTDLMSINTEIDDIPVDSQLIRAGEFADIFGLFINEIKEYANKTIEAEKKKIILEGKEKTIAKEYKKIENKVNQLESEIEEKDLKIKELENYNKKIQKLDMHLKLLQIEQKKKKPWEFWK